MDRALGFVATKKIERVSVIKIEMMTYFLPPLPARYQKKGSDYIMLTDGEQTTC
jgi:hypothetical protein